MWRPRFKRSLPPSGRADTPTCTHVWLCSEQQQCLNSPGGLNLTSWPPFQGLLSVHDAVAQRDFEPTLAPVPDHVLGEEEEEEDSVKIVSLVKTKEPLVRKHARVSGRSGQNWD